MKRMNIYHREVFLFGNIKDSHRKESKFTQSVAIAKRKNINFTGIQLIMKFNGIT